MAQYKVKENLKFQSDGVQYEILSAGTVIDSKSCQEELKIEIKTRPHLFTLIMGDAEDKVEEKIEEGDDSDIARNPAVKRSLKRKGK